MVVRLVKSCYNKDVYYKINITLDRSKMGSTLLLNSDGQPTSVIPLSTLTWQEAILHLVSDKAVVLEWYDNWTIHSANWETKVPAVMILRQYSKKKTAVRFSKQNVFLRDGYICQYCGTPVTRKTATLDHVIPVNHTVPGMAKGLTTFENTVCACATCNAGKGNNHKIVPKVKPVRPNYFQLVEKRKKQPFDFPHPSWASYLGLES
jgi:5-methylcytosine-specific restriction endonuclease McrA